MMTMDLLEQDNYYDTITTPSIPSSVVLHLLLLDEVASSKLNFHGGFF